LTDAGFFLDAYKDASSTRIALEFIAFVLGIMSVWYAKNENIWVYPTGLVATVITAYLLYLAGYLGDMMINAYFSIMSIYGWYRWAKGKQSDDLPFQEPVPRKRRSASYCSRLLF
jgi:nicotinamide mononucleotide transporter